MRHAETTRVLLLPLIPLIALGIFAVLDRTEIPLTLVPPATTVDQAPVQLEPAPCTACTMSF